MSKKIAIIGAGWYGCHIASTLQSLNLNVKVFEKKSKILDGASGNNQFRLHMGFHYARSYVTRLQSRDGFSRFLERYPALSKEVTENLYAVPKYDSVIDYLTYKMIMTSAGIEFSEHLPSDYGLAEIEGVLKCRERVLLTEKARDHFNKRLGTILQLNTAVEKIEEKNNEILLNGESFDFVIDATWGHFSKNAFSVFYEPTVLFYIKAKSPQPAITFVDGPLCSIYPTEQTNIFTLSSVEYTPIGQYATFDEANRSLNSISSEVINQKFIQMTRQAKRYLPHFNDVYEYQSPQLSMKTKLHGKQDDRSCYVSRRGRVISVMSGKIDTVFYATQRILSFLEMADEIFTEHENSHDDHQVLS